MLKVADAREIIHTRANKQASEEQYQPFLDKNFEESDNVYTGCQK
jgi:hypothetical protein